MPVRVARRPIVRWIGLAAILTFLLLWYTSGSGATTRPRWGPKTPLARPPPEPPQQKPLPPPPSVDHARPDVPGAVGHGPQLDDELPTLPQAQPLGSNDFDFLDTHPNLALDDPSTRKADTDAKKTVATIHESTMHAPTPHSSTATDTGMHAPKKTDSGSGSGSETGKTEKTDQYLTADDYLEHFKGLTEASAMTVKEAKTSCTWPSPDDVNFQYGTDKDWVKNDRPDAEIAKHQKEWQEYVKNDMIPYKNVSDKFSGRGIVVCAGNERSMMRLQVLLRMLRSQETKLPVEVHYFGDEELSAQNRTELKELFPALHFNNLNGPESIIKTKHANFYINYNVKLASMLNSRFAEPMLLDSDNVPVSDPMALFESDTYRRFGSVFYPDVARTRPENPMWAITNTACRPDEYEMESGQLVVDKRRFWYHLQLAAFFGHQDYYQEFLLGDKDCFRFAWHALKTPYGRPARWLTSVGFVARPRAQPAWPDADKKKDEFERAEDRFQGGKASFYCGHSFGQHHPDGVRAPILFMHGGLVKTLNQEQIVYVRKHGRGLYGAYKQSAKANAISDVPERTHIKFDGGVDYLDAQRDGKLDHIAHCIDMAAVEPAPVGDAGTPELATFEHAFERAGGFWMLNQTMWDAGHGVWG